MKNQDVVVFGMGRFGTSVAKQLEANGCKVMAVDSNEKRVKAVSDYVTVAVCADVSDEEAMEELGIHNFDIAVVSIGHNTEASVLATIWIKEHGIKRVIAKAADEIHGKILLKVGADEVVYPEREMGIRLANNLTLHDIINAVDVAGDCSIVKLPAPKEWVGKSLGELHLRNKYKVNVIAIQNGDTVQITPDANVPIKDGEVLMVLGQNKMLNELPKQ